ncbi:MAG: hypothetical protein V3W37_11240 [Candidatus Binatia bacterium]
MGNIDLKRTLILASVVGLLVLGGMHFLGDSGSNIPPAGSPPKAGGKGMALPPPPTMQEAAPRTDNPPETRTTPPGAGADKPITVPFFSLGTAARRNLSDPFQGFTAELVRLRKEAEILESKIRILELKAKEAEARLKEKRAQGLSSMIEKDPKILLNLLGDTNEPGGIILDQSSRLQTSLPQSTTGRLDEDLKRIIRGRIPTVRMVILGRDKRVTVDYQGDTFTLSVGDRVRDIEVVNITPRGAIFRVNGKQEFVPLSENPLTGEKREETVQIENPR